MQNKINYFYLHSTLINYTGNIQVFIFKKLYSYFNNHIKRVGIIYISIVEKSCAGLQEDRAKMLFNKKKKREQAHLIVEVE